MASNTFTNHVGLDRLEHSTLGPSFQAFQNYGSPSAPAGADDNDLVEGAAINQNIDQHQGALFSLPGAKGGGEVLLCGEQGEGEEGDGREKVEVMAAPATGRFQENSAAVWAPVKGWANGSETVHAFQANHQDLHSGASGARSCQSYMDSFSADSYLHQPHQQQQQQQMLVLRRSLLPPAASTAPVVAGPVAPAPALAAPAAPGARVPCRVAGCGQDFSTKGHEKGHYENVHLRLRPHVCDVPGCAKDFYFAAALARHKRSMHKL